MTENEINFLICKKLGIAGRIVHYSKSLKLSFQIIDWFIKQDFDISLRGDKQTWAFTVSKSDEAVVSCHSHTAPLAICRAFIKVNQLTV